MDYIDKIQRQKHHRRTKMERRDDCDGCDDDFESRGCKLTVTIVTTVTDRNIHRKSKIIVLKRKAGTENDSDNF